MLLLLGAVQIAAGAVVSLGRSSVTLQGFGCMLQTIWASAQPEEIAFEQDGKSFCPRSAFRCASRLLVQLLLY